MSVQYDATRSKYVVRWREDGRQRTRRFADVADAEAFDASVNPTAHRSRPSAGGEWRLMALERVAKVEAERERGQSQHGIYPYATKRGVRWRIVFRQSDGTLSSRRGFTSRTAAATARRRLQESVDRGEVKVSREDFATYWDRFLADRRAYMTRGSHADLVTHGRKRLIPFFGADRLATIDEDRVREWMSLMIELVEAGELAPKTVNNARTCLSVAFNEAVRRGLMASNPCAHVPALPIERRELEYLRLAEIQPYLDACADRYALLAAFLIGTGARISEAVAVRWPDIELDQSVLRIYRQRARETDRTRATKGKRFRSVQIGPALAAALRTVHNHRIAHAIEDDGWVFICPPPMRGRYAKRTRPVPPHRKTVHDWHEAALGDAGLRDMPLHALRHTAAAAWLAVGHPLIFVQRQLGHRSITTTEEHYGHLEGSFVRDAAVRTEQAIDAARAMLPTISSPADLGSHEAGIKR